ncbi:hypothetical protein DL98DRAFT_632881 [Cadophora sp. DSE1049]|nr:hypothetical protein DL98DRAFT_632881 [Cadophora sp. DSE1049]
MTIPATPSNIDNSKSHLQKTSKSSVNGKKNAARFTTTERSVGKMRRQQISRWASEKDVAISGTQIMKCDFSSLVNWNVKGEEMTTNCPSIMDEYLRLVVDHVNKERADFKAIIAIKEAEEKADAEAREALKKGKKVEMRNTERKARSRSRSPRKLRPRQVRVRSPLAPKKDKTASAAPHLNCKVTSVELDPKKDKTSPPVVQPSCKMISVERFEKILIPAKRGPPSPKLIPNLDVELTKILQEIDADPANSRTLDYLFIPVHISGAHMVLIGLAPKQKFAFVLDSHMVAGPTNPNPVETAANAWYTKALKALLLMLDPTVKFSKNNKSVTVADRGRVWHLFGQYVLRSRKTDRSPNAVQQHDTYNCGAYTITNAFCMAFGYDLECFKEHQLNKWKKARVAFELLQKGFRGHYDYDLIEISEEDVTLLQESDEEGLSETDLDSDGDFEMQYGFENSPAGSTSADSGYDSGEESEGSDGEVDEKAEADPERAFLTAAEAHRLERPRAKRQLDRLPWPRQFSRTKFQRAGFIYPAPSVNFRPELKYSKRELKKACRNFPLDGWKSWSKQNQPLFLEWMLNEMAATLSRMRGDLVPPAGYCESAHHTPEESATTGEKRKRVNDEEDSGEQEGSKKHKVRRKT